MLSRWRSVYNLNNMNNKVRFNRFIRSLAPPAVKKRRKEKNALVRELSSCIFWDMDISKLDVWEDRNFIIERVYSRGYEKDEKLLWKIYSWREIRNTAVKLDELTESALAYLSVLFNIKETKFKCYGKKLSHLYC